MSRNIESHQCHSCHQWRNCISILLIVLFEYIHQHHQRAITSIQWHTQGNIDFIAAFCIHFHTGKVFTLSVSLLYLPRKCQHSNGNCEHGKNLSLSLFSPLKPLPPTLFHHRTTKKPASFCILKVIYRIYKKKYGVLLGFFVMS